MVSVRSRSFRRRYSYCPSCCAAACGAIKSAASASKMAMVRFMAGSISQQVSAILSFKQVPGREMQRPECRGRTCICFHPILYIGIPGQPTGALRPNYPKNRQGTSQHAPDMRSGRNPKAAPAVTLHPRPIIQARGLSGSHRSWHPARRAHARSHPPKQEGRARRNRT